MTRPTYILYHTSEVHADSAMDSSNLVHKSSGKKTRSGVDQQLIR